MIITIEQIVTLLSLLVALFAWIAKIKWSKEYRLAKEEIIKSKDAIIDNKDVTINNLKEKINFYIDMTPMKIQEYHNSIKKSLEEYNDSLQKELDVAKMEIYESKKAIEKLNYSEILKIEKIYKIENEKINLKNIVNELESQKTKIEKSIIRNTNQMRILPLFKSDLSENEIFVFTPRYDIIALPKGATVLDFAYYIHSEIGNKCVKAKVNERNTQLNHILKTFDTVEIFTSSEQKPKDSWLELVTTPRAKNKIKKTLHNK